LKYKTKRIRRVIIFISPKYKTIPVLNNWTYTLMRKIKRSQNYGQALRISTSFADIALKTVIKPIFQMTDIKVSVGRICILLHSMALGICCISVIRSVLLLYRLDNLINSIFIFCHNGIKRKTISVLLLNCN
jgi:hypothetical protein